TNNLQPNTEALKRYQQRLQPKAGTNLQPQGEALQRLQQRYQPKAGTPSGNRGNTDQLQRSGGSTNNLQPNTEALKRYQQRLQPKAGTNLQPGGEALQRFQQKYQPKAGSPSKNLGTAGESLERYRRLDVGKIGGKPAGDAAFLKHNFPTQYKNFLKDSQGGFKSQLTPHYRVNHEALQTLNRNNSFVKKHDVDGHWFDNHWTHHNNLWNQTNGNWYWNRYPHWNDSWGHHHFCWYPWIGWGGWGLWGHGFGWPAWTVGYYTVPYYGYNYYYAAAPVYTTSYQTAASAPPAAAANPTLSGADQGDEVTEADAASAAAFADQGEIDFKAGNYHAAAKDWQHSLVDDPKNGAVMMLLAQALMALGKYEEAAGATQAAMQMLPEDKWGVVVANYTQLFGNVQDYTDQLRTLEAARTAQPDSPALRFLLGFQFGYLNYPKQAVTELDKALVLAPRDVGSRKIRELFAARWPEAPPLPAAVLKAAEETRGPASAPAARPANPPAPADAKPADKIGTPSS
ncbi:MAG: tetratricopeptide repeat protein, partial [Pirellulales bacterium]